MSTYADMEEHFTTMSVADDPMDIDNIASEEEEEEIIPPELVEKLDIKIVDHDMMHKRGLFAAQNILDLALKSNSEADGKFAMQSFYRYANLVNNELRNMRIILKYVKTLNDRVEAAIGEIKNLPQAEEPKRKKAKTAAESDTALRRAFNLLCAEPEPSETT